jgi:hypothetical protein
LNFIFINSPGYDWGKKKETKEPEAKREKKESLLWPTLYFHAIKKPLIPISAYLTVGFVGATSKSIHSIENKSPFYCFQWTTNCDEEIRKYGIFV